MGTKVSLKDIIKRQLRKDGVHFLKRGQIFQIEMLLKTKSKQNQSEVAVVTSQKKKQYIQVITRKITYLNKPTIAVYFQNVTCTIK